MFATPIVVYATPSHKGGVRRMTQVRTGVDAPEGSGMAPTRAIRRRSGIPSGRAVVGGFLVAAATVGMFAAYSRATAGPTTTYAVAARDLAPGDRIAPGAVELVALDLPDEQRRRSYDAVDPLIDATVVEPLLAGELIQEGALIATGAEVGTRTVSFGIDAAHAVNGTLKAGERIDLLATFGSGTEACTQLIAADVPVVAISETTGTLVSEGGGLTVTVQVVDADMGVAVAHAANASAMTIMRATDAEPGRAERFCTPTGSGASSG